MLIRFTLTIVCCMICNWSLAQSLYNLTFQNGTVSNGQFCVDILVSYDVAAKLGSSNFYFSYDQSNLSNPVISSHALTNNYSEPTLSNPAGDLGAFNIVLNAINQGIAVGTTPVQVGRICYDVADNTVPLKLTWITSGRFESIVFLDNEANLLAPGTMTNFNETIFPVNWLSFTGQQQGADIQLNWSTDSEINNKEFEVERSLDGNSFEIIGSVAGQGNSTQVNNYLYLDEEILKLGVKNFTYRLRQVDYDGSFEYSPTVEITLDQTKSLYMEVYPNPFTDKVSIDYSTLNTDSRTLKIISALGQELYIKDLEEESGTVQVNTDNWTQGIYYISIHTGDKKQVYKVFKN